MICFVIRDYLDCYVLHIIRMNYNGRYANYECDNFKKIYKKCVRTM